MKISMLAVTAFLCFSGGAFASEDHTEELNPYASDISEQLRENDSRHEADRVLQEFSFFNFKNSCYRETCPVYIEVDKSRQRAQLFVNGVAIGAGEWKATTGMEGYGTPNFDRSLEQPLRAYTRYSSSKYPGGDWNGLGNMPYAVFIKGGFAVHGTPEANIRRLGTVPLSHGCIRVHPNNGKIFNDLAKKFGASQTWVWVHD